MLLVRDFHTSQSGGIHDSVDSDELAYDGDWPSFCSLSDVLSPVLTVPLTVSPLNPSLPSWPEGVV